MAGESRDFTHVTFEVFLPYLKVEFIPFGYCFAGALDLTAVGLGLCANLPQVKGELASSLKELPQKVI